MLEMLLAAGVAAIDLAAVRSPLIARPAPDGGDVLTVIVEPDRERRDLVQAVWSIPAGGGDPSRLAEGGGNPRWSPDGTQVAFLAREGERRQLFVMRPDGSGRRLLAAFEGGVDDHLWSPDGRRIAVVAAPAPGEAPQIHLVEAGSGASRPLTGLTERLVVSPWDPEGNLSWSPDGKHLAFAVKPTPRFDDDYRSDVCVVDVSDGTLRRLTAREGMDLKPAFSPDGERIAFRTSFGRLDRYANHGIAIVSVDGGEVRDVGRSMELGFLDGPYWHDWLDDSTVLFAAPEHASIHVFSLDVGTGRVAPVTEGDAAHVRPGLARGAGVLAFLRSDAGSPWDVWRMAVGSRSERMTRLNPGLEDPSAGYERIRWKAPDGMEIEGLLARPAGAGPFPLVVYLHGGPEGMVFHAYEPEVPLPAAETLVVPPSYYRSRGWAVFYPNFRGSGGYGERLRRAALADWSRGFADDVLSGVEALRAAGVSDGERVFLTGSWRSGSTKVLGLLGRTRRFRAAAAFSAYPDVEALARERDDFHLQHHALFGGAPDQAPEAWRTHSPIHRVAEIATPLLLVHDENDFAIRAEQSLAVHRILSEKRVPGQLVLYRSRTLRDDAALVDRLFAWFHSHL